MRYGMFQEIYQVSVLLCLALKKGRHFFLRCVSTQKPRIEHVWSHVSFLPYFMQENRHFAHETKALANNLKSLYSFAIHIVECYDTIENNSKILGSTR